MRRLASCAAVAVLSAKLFDSPWYVALGSTTLLYLLTGGWKWIRLAYLTLRRDLTIAKIIIRMQLMVRSYLKRKIILSDIFSAIAKDQPNKAAFVSADTGKTLTFREAEELSFKIANIFYEAGYRKGDTVALLMENRIEFVPIWIGLSRIGVVTSLINFNLHGNSLLHCINISKCKAIIFSEEMIRSLHDVVDGLNVEFYCFDDCKATLPNSKDMQAMLRTVSSLPPPQNECLSLSDELLHIFTSGTTGLPKAAVIRGVRFIFMCQGAGSGTGISKDDVLYNALPLYHSNGGIIMAGQTLSNGCTLVVRKKFSASRYFEDCTKFNVSVINYIGETCRYLLAQPTSQYDKAHKIRVATGNGLRASIWCEFRDRFNISSIVEFYGSTEGNANMINNTGRVGSVGYNSVLFPWVHPIKLIKVDEDTGEIVRDKNGLAVEAKVNEAGHLVGKVLNDAIHKFDGYLDKAATQKKIARDIFSKGDSVFLSGDVLIQDEEGYYYFQDRTGDTFRWKGENVSTNEVEGVISKSLQLSDVVVYGVEVPGVEGRAGMACICDPKREVNLTELHNAMQKSLPAYAIPVFVRLAAEIQKTATFKFQKNKLRDEAFDPSCCCSQDDLFYFDGKAGKFVTINVDVYHAILEQKVRF